ncbi:MAG TPA: hypothetical protein VM513_30540, partial [Kofleriaceae bacterium]|nr:hypothetical protein [Kofleriaceae bacterium]
MRRLLLALLLASAACGDDATTPGDGGAGDATVDSAPPPPQCPDGAPTGAPADQTTPGDASLPSPTLRSLTVEWLIDGDANLNATVGVRFRTDGGTWRQGLPLRRIPAETIVTGGTWTWANRFAGSLFDLEPATTYEVELALLDPDGGCEVRSLTATTRTVPAPMAGAPVIATTPGTFAANAAAAQPGQILELAAGDYPTFTFTKDGTATAPIVIRAAAGATVNITGDVRLDGRAFVIVEGLRIAGKIKFNDGHDLALVRNQITTTEDGITTKTRAENVYIADNTVVGATAWNEAALGVDGANIGEGIQVTGPGHVIEHNRVSGFRDCISLIEGTEAIEQHSIDIAHNDLSECADDAIEADFCFHDCRVVGNRVTNSFIGLSSQPGLGGPTYFIRNVQFNVLLTPFKLQRGSIGDVLLHNTVVKRGDAFGIFTTDVFSRQYARNNLFLGGDGGTYNTYDIGNGRVISLAAAGTAVDLDYDGYGGTMFAGRIGAVTFSSLDELRASTTEQHAVEIDAAAFATPATIPASPFPS